MRIVKGYDTVWKGNIESVQIHAGVKINSVAVIGNETCLFINKDDHIIIEKGLKGRDGDSDYIVIKPFSLILSEIVIP